MQLDVSAFEYACVCVFVCILSSEPGENSLQMEWNVNQLPPES